MKLLFDIQSGIPAGHMQVWKKTAEMRVVANSDIITWMNVLLSKEDGNEGRFVVVGGCIWSARVIHPADP